MRRLVPSTLRGQLVVVIIATFVVAQGVSLWFFVDERSLAVRAALGLEAADRAANIVRLIEEAPADLRPAILRAANSPLVRFSLGPAPAVDHPGHDDGGRTARRIRTLLGEDDARDIRVELHRVEKAMAPMPGMPEEAMGMHGEMMRGAAAPVEMQISVAVAGGQWLNVATRFHSPPLQWPWISIAIFGLTAVLIVGFVWLALNRLTGPLRRLARAAERLGRGEPVPELPEQGPEELRSLTAAFNDMQDRLTRFVAERTRLLAALGHDLRSPLTAMRLRAEMVEDDETRERLAAIIEEMQQMVEATLSFARGMATSEPPETVDLVRFVGDLAREAREAGGEVVMAGGGGPPLPVRLRPNAMRRALRNVIENAIRYGKRAGISLSRGEGVARIVIRDEGPGIPPEELERVFDPFVRLEESRSLETGGTGLGLSIARTIIHAHGGEIRLRNRKEGGLEAEITLPLGEGGG